MTFLSRLFDTSDFPARWNCGDWSLGHGWLHILSDLGVWSAYLAIPLVLIYFLLRRKDLPFRMIFLLFGAFILACGTTHLMEAIIFWWPAYRLAGIIKLFTALVSWTTVFALVQVVPKVLTLRSPEELEREIEARKQAERALQQANDNLERRIQDRTLELAAANGKLHQEREWFRTTLACIGDAVVTTDTGGRVTFLNTVAEELTCQMFSEAIGMPLVEVCRMVNEQTRQPLEVSPKRTLPEEGVGLAKHAILIAKDGTERRIDNSAAPIRDETGAVLGVVLIFRDVTERIRMEEELRQADRRKDEFLAILAHELRNPLAPVRNSLEIIKRAEANSALIDDARSTMERQVGQMVRLIDDLLDISRISRNKLELRKERVELASIIHQVVEACRPLAAEAKHELIVRLPGDPIHLNADAVRLAQVVGNLLTNACKYTENGGRIWISLEREGSDAVVNVKDTGIGIPLDMLPRVFEMFTQLDQSLERTKGGLGIGLALVKRLVEMHGGTVTARSEGLERGSEFVVRLPILIEPPIASATTETTGENAPATFRRILVADDNRDSATTLAMLLKLIGNDTRMAHDGQQAIEVAAAYKPDMILLDIGMPNLNGYDACRAIREESWGKDIVIFALTGWGQEEDRRKSKEAGFDGHLVKPVDYSQLMKLMAETKRN